MVNIPEAMSKTTIGYLGPPGTFSDQAAQDYQPSSRRSPYESIAACIAGLRDGEIDIALVPIDNTFGGSINDTVDALIRFSDIVIVDEFYLRVEQHLIGVGPIGFESITAVLSHPQPLAQCRDFLDKSLPRARRVAVASTAQAVESLSTERPDEVAIGPAMAAGLYGRCILASNIEDHSNNTTRFVALRCNPSHPPGPTGSDRTTLVVSLADQPGALVRALSVFDALNVNMSKIESRPMAVADREAPFGQAIFRIDIDGHRHDDAIRIALQALEHKAVSLRVAGSYPRRAAQ
jgi:prephenate dehydratase